MDIPHILDNGKDIAFYCARLEGKTTLTACEELCPRHSSCDTAGMANDELASYERSEKTGYGLEELIRKANCKNYAEFVIFLYDIGAFGRNRQRQGILTKRAWGLCPCPFYKER